MYLNKELKIHYNRKKYNRVRKTVIPGNTKSLWKAVKTAKDVNTASIPNQVYDKDKQLVEMEDLPQ